MIVIFKENLWFSDVFRGYRNVTLDENGLRNNTVISLCFHVKSNSHKKRKSFFPPSTEMSKVKETR